MKTELSTTVHNIKATLTFKGSKTSNWGAGKEQHHVLRVTNLESKKYRSFDFWSSKAKPTADNEKDVLGALSCVYRDALAADQSLTAFIYEFGYSDKEGKNIYNACLSILDRLEKIGLSSDDICDALNNELNDF